MAKLPSKLPTAEDLGALPSARSGRQIATVDTTAVGRGMASMGEQISRLGGALTARGEADRRETEREEAERLEMEFLTWKAQRDADFDERRRGVTGDPTGFAASVDQDYFNAGREFFARARTMVSETPGVNHPALTALSRTMRRHQLALAARALDAERDHRSVYESGRANEALTTLTDSYLNAPDDATRERLREDAERLLLLGRQRGVSESAYARLRENSVGRWPELDAMRHAERDPVGALTELRSGDERGGMESSGEFSERGRAFLRRIAPDTPTAEIARASQWVRDNLPDGSTQLQHDALVTYGALRGQDALEALAPSLRENNWPAVRTLMAAGSIDAVEQPNPDGARPAPTTALPRPGQSTVAGAITWGAGQLGIQPEILAGMIHRETAGSMSTDRRGGYGNAYVGYIQFSPENQRRYGIRPGMSPDEQMVQVVRYMRDRFALAGMDPRTATPAQLYAAILAGDPRLVNAADRNGSAAMAVPDILRRGRDWWSRNGVDAEARPADTRSRDAEIADMIVGQAPSSRYASLGYERRQTLANNISVAHRNRIKDEINSDLARIERYGEPRTRADGRTSFDEGRVILTPNQRTAMEQAVDEAYRVHAAQAGLNNMTRAEAEAHLESLQPSRTEDGESFATSQRVAQRTAEFWNAIQTQRETDPAAAVSGSNLTLGRGGRVVGGRRRLGEAGLTTVPDEEDQRIQPAPEVQSVIDGIRRREPERYIALSGEGEPVAAESGRPPQAAWMRITNPNLTPDERRAIITARMEAQRRLGFTATQPITRAEATELLNVPSNLSDTEFDNRVRTAIDRAERLFGTGMARQVVESAIAFNVSTDARRRTASSMIYSLARGETMTPNDLARLARQQRIDEETALFRYGAPSDPAGLPRGDTLGAQGQRALDFMAASEGGLGEPWAATDRPSISPQFTQTGRDPFAGVSVNTTPRAARTPSPSEIEELRRAPEHWQIFDELYGLGAASRVLGRPDLYQPPRPRGQQR